MPLKLSAFPKCYIDRIAGDRTMSVFDWIEMAKPLDADGLEMYDEFFTSLDPGYLDSVGDAIRAAGFAMPMLCCSPDFTNPDAKRWFQSKLVRLLRMGVHAFKTDFGEEIPTDVVYHDGSDPERMHNFYTFLYNKAVFEMLEQERGKQEALVFARSATATCQRFPVHWGGDCYGNYESMASDWLFIPELTRAIHVDIRYVLWIMDAVDGAHHLMREMGVTPSVQ